MTVEIKIEDNPFLLPLDNEETGLQIKNIIEDMLKFTKDMIVDNEESYKSLTSVYAKAREWKKVIEQKRKSLVEPFRKQCALINDKAAELTDPLDEVIEASNYKANAYVRQLEQAKKQEDDKLRKAADLFDAAHDLYIPPMENTVRGEGAMTVKKIEKKFRILDLSKVPKKYLMVNELAVKADLKMGIGEIPGLEIYEEETTQLRVR